MYLSNNTKIKYLKVMDKVYQINHISFYYMSLEASEKELTIDDIPADELWDIEDLKNYKINLINSGGQAEVIDFTEWKNRKCS